MTRQALKALINSAPSAAGETGNSDTGNTEYFLMQILKVLPPASLQLGLPSGTHVAVRMTQLFPHFPHFLLLLPDILPNGIQIIIITNTCGLMDVRNTFKHLH